MYVAGLVGELIVDVQKNILPYGFAFGVVNAIEATLFVLCAALIAGGGDAISGCFRCAARWP